MTYIILKSGKFVKVPEGADTDTFRKFAEAREAMATKPHKTARHPRQTGKRVHRASDVLNRSSKFEQDVKISLAMAEQVDRVNGEDDDA